MGQQVNEVREDNRSWGIQIYPLLPKILQEGEPGYEAVLRLKAALKVAFEEKGIRNIALSGGYASGKSSILKTLRKELEVETVALKREVLEISGARLCETEFSETEANPVAKEKFEAEVEYSILKQLVYRENIDAMPSSRMRRIRHIDQYYRWFLSIGLIATLVIMFKPLPVLFSSLYQWTAWIYYLAEVFAIAFLLFIATNVVYHVVPSFINWKLGKLSLNGATIEEIESSSIFNKHLDEILYFFKATNYNVVFIEGLDRLGTLEIFTKLKGLNALLNTSKSIGRYIVFIYAVRDDLFTGEERTKFFDYIVPVIPLINSSNSAEKLKEKLGAYAERISDDDLDEIAFFIQDMRMLINIVNEFELYHAELCKEVSSLSLTKLLAMIAYKNYHPDDFAKLQRGEGKIYKCFDNLKGSLICKLKEAGNEVRSTKLSELLSDEREGFVKLVKQEIEQYNLPPLMEVFLRKGYLDEDYYDYLSYFHEGMLTRNDYHILQSMKLGIPQPPDTKIENLDCFYRRLKSYMFESLLILNNSLVDYIVQTNKPINPIIDLIVSNPADAASFLTFYYNEGKQRGKFCESLTKRDKDLSWSYINNHKELSVREFLRAAWFRAAGDLSRDDDKLKNYYHFIATHMEQIGRERCFELCDMAEFTYIQPSLNRELFDYVIEKNAYKLNEANLSIIASFLLPGEVVDPLKMRFSTFLRTKNIAVVNYISTYWNKIQSLFGRNLEERVSIRTLLVPSITQFTQEGHRFPDYTTIAPSAYDFVTESHLIEPRWDKVFFFFEKKDQSLTKELSEYLESFHKVLAQQSIDIDEIDEQYRQGVSALHKAIKRSRDISEGAREALISAFPLPFSLW